MVAINLVSDIKEWRSARVLAQEDGIAVAASSKYLTCPTESLIRLTRQVHPKGRDNSSDGFLLSFLPALSPSDSAL